MPFQMAEQRKPRKKRTVRYLVDSFDPGHMLYVPLRRACDDPSANFAKIRTVRPRV